PGSRFENMSFSNLVFQDVTGPIHISIGPGGRGPSSGPAATRPRELPESRTPAVVRNISFSNIKGTVTSDPQSFPDLDFIQNYNPGEKLSCITLNCVGDAVLENISFDDIHLTFGGGGTAQAAARRELPPIAGEYFMLGEMPAYAFYARNARGITLNNVRFQFEGSELRPAVILDHVEDVTINGMSVQGDPKAESVLQFINTKFTLLTAPRLLTQSPVFLRVEGAESGGIVVNGGDISRAASPTAFAEGAQQSSVTLRS